MAGVNISRNIGQSIVVQVSAEEDGTPRWAEITLTDRGPRGEIMVNIVAPRDLLIVRKEALIRRAMEQSAKDHEDRELQRYDRD